MHDEDALVAQARGGDRDAFALLVTAHREAVYRSAYWILKDAEDALDATQEAMLRAFRHLGGFDGRSSFRTWARRIATNVALDRVGRRNRERSHTAALPQDDLVGDERVAPLGEDLEREEERRLVRAAIEELPPAQKAAVLLRDVEGLSYEEIGEQLGIPKGTVMSRLYYGRQTLKEKLASLLGPRAESMRQARATEVS